MERIDWTPDLTLPDRPRVAALGAFDGLHLGHVQTIRAMRRMAYECDAEAVVLTFNRSPREFRDGSRRPGRRLTPIDEQIYYLRRLGIDLVVVFEFPSEIHALEPEDFVRDVLVDQFGIIRVSASATHRFGHRGAGDLVLLQKLGDKLGFGVETVPPLTIAGEPVSSTRIRALLAAGEVSKAGALLGRPYAAYAPVVCGRRMGTQIGFPTANLSMPPEKTLPGDGVYAGVCGKIRESDYDVLEEPRAAAINVGVAPTLARDERLVEVHVVGEQCDLLDSTIKVEFLRWLRGEQRFNSVEELSAQIARDAASSAAEAGRPLSADLCGFERACTSDYRIVRDDLDS